MSKGVKTLMEIAAQPSAWQRCLKELKHNDLHRLTNGLSPLEVEWIFIGCGTSYYLAQAAAFSFSALLKTAARAVPASEALLNPELVFPRGAKSYYPVLISRSGHTSELLSVAGNLSKEGVPFLAVTCDGRELMAATNHVLKLDIAEESTVMTSSFTSMLLALQYLAATFADDKEFLKGLFQLPTHLERLLEANSRKVEEFAQLPFDNVAMLGQGALFPIASESALKVMESSSTFAQSFHTLEFRHGPKSIAGPSTLVGALISDSGYAAESSVLLEMKELGSPIFAVANEATGRLCSEADLLIELELPVPEPARLVIYVVWGQLLGSYRGIEKGLNPDHPKNLSRVVTI